MALSQLSHIYKLPSHIHTHTHSHIHFSPVYTQRLLQVLAILHIQRHTAVHFLLQTNRRTLVDSYSHTYTSQHSLAHRHIHTEIHMHTCISLAHRHTVFRRCVCTHTDTRCHILPLTLSYTHTLSLTHVAYILILICTLFLTLSQTLRLSHSFKHSPTPSFSLFPSLSHAHTYTHFPPHT